GGLLLLERELGVGVEVLEELYEATLVFIDKLRDLLAQLGVGLLAGAKGGDRPAGNPRPAEHASGEQCRGGQCRSRSHDAASENHEGWTALSSDGFGVNWATGGATSVSWTLKKMAYSTGVRTRDRTAATVSPNMMHTAIAPKNGSVSSGIDPRTVVSTAMHTGRTLLTPPSRSAWYGAFPLSISWSTLLSTTI